MEQIQSKKTIMELCDNGFLRTVRFAGAALFFTGRLVDKGMKTQ